MRRILVLRGGALGDFLVTLPALATLRARWPEAVIELAGNAHAGRLALARDLLQAVHSQHEARWSALFRAEELPADFGTWLARFDLVLNFWPDPDGCLRRHFPRTPQQVFLSAPALPTIAPAAAPYCAPLRSLGLEPRDWIVPLAPGPTGSPAIAAPRSGLLVHPGSGSPRKNWPRERWMQLLPRLPRPVGVILGEAEREAWSGFAPAGVTLLVERPLEELVTQLARCRLFLGHDSGISHLAAACGAPGVLLFGPTDPAMWAPPTPAMRTLRRGTDLNAITVEDVHAAVTAALQVPS